MTEPRTDGIRSSLTWRLSSLSSILGLNTFLLGWVLRIIAVKNGITLNYSVCYKHVSMGKKGRLLNWFALMKNNKSLQQVLVAWLVGTLFREWMNQMERREVGREWGKEQREMGRGQKGGIRNMCSISLFLKTSIYN